MTNAEFNDIIRRQAAFALATLTAKGQEYGAEEDRLKHFKVAATLQGETEAKALLGMMSKHLVSIADLCGKPDPKNVPLEVWDEKLGDAINYLLILAAVIREDRNNA